MAMGLSAEEIDAIGTAALLHDIGNLAVPEYILRKREPLTKEEEKTLKQHPSLGAKIISDIKFPYPVASAVRSHHERFDGSGYPDGLKGEEVPALARIIAIVDCYDAMATDRPYHRARDHLAIMRMMFEANGGRYDPYFAAKFAAIIESSPYRSTGPTA